MGFRAVKMRFQQVWRKSCLSLLIVEYRGLGTQLRHNHVIKILASCGVLPPRPTPTPAKANLVISRPMKVADPPLETPAERYGRRQVQHALGVLRTGGTDAEVSRAVAILTGYTRTLRRGKGQQLELTLPGAVRGDFGWEPRTHVTLWRTAAGGLELRTARPEDFPRDVRLALEAVDQVRGGPERKPKLKHFERTCRGCGKTFCACSPRVEFCTLCGWRRKRAQNRAWWARSGRKTASYKRKLRPSAPAEAIAAPAVA